MWRLKSKYVLEKENKLIQDSKNTNRLGRALNTGIWVFIIAFISHIILSLTLGIDYSPYRMDSGITVKPNEIFEYFPEYLQRASYWGVAFLIIRLIWPSIFRDKSNTIMCDKCNKTKAFDSNLTCVCGGHFYNLDKFEWIEEKEELNISDLSWIDKHKVMKNEG